MQTLNFLLFCKTFILGNTGRTKCILDSVSETSTIAYRKMLEHKFSSPSEQNLFSKNLHIPKLYIICQIQTFIACFSKPTHYY